MTEYKQCLTLSLSKNSYFLGSRADYGQEIPIYRHELAHSGRERQTQENSLSGKVSRRTDRCGEQYGSCCETKAGLAQTV